MDDKQIIILISSIIILLLVCYIIITYIIFNKFFKRIKREIPLLEEDLTITHYKPYIPILEEYHSYCKTLEYENIYVQSYDNLKLRARYYNYNSDKTIIFIHGYKATPENNFSILIKFFKENGFNLLLVDQRSHGLSEGKYITFSSNEHKDVIKWVDKINQDYNPKSIILCGASMGASTVAGSCKLGLPKNVKALILDCGFTSGYEMVKHQLKYNLGALGLFAYPCMRVMGKLIGKFNLKANDVRDALSNNEIPLIWIHGKKDKMVPFEMGKQNVEANKGKKIFIETNVGHCLSIYEKKRKIEENIKNYIKIYC